MGIWYVIVKCPSCNLLRTVEVTQKKWVCPVCKHYNEVRSTKRYKDGETNG